MRHLSSTNLTYEEATYLRLMVGEKVSIQDLQRIKNRRQVFSSLWNRRLIEFRAAKTRISEAGREALEQWKRDQGSKE